MEEPGPFGQQWRLGRHLHSAHPPHRGRVKRAQHHLSSYYHRAKRCGSGCPCYLLRATSPPPQQAQLPASKASCVALTWAASNTAAGENTLREALLRSPALLKSCFSSSGSPWCLQEPLLHPTQPLANAAPTCWFPEPPPLGSGLGWTVSCPSAVTRPAPLFRHQRAAPLAGRDPARGLPCPSPGVQPTLTVT